MNQRKNKTAASVLLMLLLASCPAAVHGQGLSDSQALELLKREAGTGASQAQIASKLLKRGVTMEQLRRLSQTASSGTSDTESATTEGAVGSRLRQSSGEGTVVVDIAGESTELELSELLSEAEMLTPDGRKVFGRDIFNNKLLTFEPNMNIATPQEYVLGPGDQVFVDIYGASQRTEQLEVSPEGNVTVPGYGPVKVGGLTVEAAQRKIYSTLGSRYSSSKLSLTVGQTRSISVNVMGEVRTPGTYQLSAFATVFHALYMAGGIGPLGTLRDIKVFRQGRQVASVDVYEYILNGRLAGNVRLYDNDVVIVGPYTCLVDITGSVRRPLTYEMKPSESVGSLIAYAGGYVTGAYEESVRVTRHSGEKSSVHNVSSADQGTFRVSDGDVVEVMSLPGRYENAVRVEGAVFRPGGYSLADGVTTVGRLVERSGGLTEQAFTGRAVLSRMKNDRTREVQSVDLAGILSGTSADITLRNEDILTIASQRDRLESRTVSISGEVMSPDTYDYADHMSVEDLIVLAGGLTDQASEMKVDVSRRLYDPKATEAGRSIAKTYSFALKDGLVVDGTAGFELAPYDVVQVRRSPGFSTPRGIIVEGEVNFTGGFTLETKTQRLSDAVRAAGGVTSEAYVKGARLMRRMNDDERARMQAVIEMARRNVSERDSVDLEAITIPTEYSVGIHLDKALRNPGGHDDIVLREGDRLIVPEYDGTVRISGEVPFSNTVAYHSGHRSYKWYVNQAGGFTQQARKRKAFIVYQNGTMSLARKGKIEPGCEVIVPTRVPRDTQGVQQWVGLGTSMASLATMFVTLANLMK